MRKERRFVFDYILFYGHTNRHTKSILTYYEQVRVFVSVLQITTYKRGRY